MRRHWLDLAAVQLLMMGMQCTAGDDMENTLSQGKVVSYVRTFSEGGSGKVPVSMWLTHPVITTSSVQPPTSPHESYAETSNSPSFAHSEITGVPSYHTPAPSHSHTTTLSPHSATTSLSPYHTTVSSPHHTTSLAPYQTSTASIWTSFSNAISSPSAVSESNFVTTTPGPESSHDMKFELLLYTIPPLAFIIVVVTALFLALCIRRYRKHRRYRHHLQMPLEEIDSSSEGSGSDNDEMNEQQSREAAFVVHHGRQQTQPILVFEEDT